MSNIKSFLFFYLFVLVSFAQSNSDSKKKWPSSQHNNKLMPNLEPDYPKFTPFDNGSSKVQNDDDESENENFAVNDKKSPTESIEEMEESLMDKIMPFTDYMFELYKVYKSSHDKNKLNDKKDDEANNGTLDIYDLDDESDDELSQTITTTSTLSPNKKNNKRKRKKVMKYNVGPGVNVSLDIPNEVVKVNLDENSLKDVFTGKFSRLLNSLDYF